MKDTTAAPASTTAFNASAQSSVAPSEKTEPPSDYDEDEDVDQATKDDHYRFLAFVSSPPEDIVTKFLQYVDATQRNIETCKKGTWHVSLDRGAVSYGPERYMDQALKTVSTANMLTRIWQSEKLADVHDNEDFFYNIVVSNVENDPNIFAFGNCYDKLQFRNYTLFCPFAYRQPNGVINVKDLSVEYKYLTNESEWFYQARMKVDQVLRTREESKGKF
ncbi:uncharacterized protein [Diadema antillarum]|uniref:uncharacterized protein n=1 Tax=Diadema antillarum TaxID=105358 RepID=UPI003A85FA7C